MGITCVAGIASGRGGLQWVKHLLIIPTIAHIITILPIIIATISPTNTAPPLAISKYFIK